MTTKKVLETERDLRHQDEAAWGSVDDLGFLFLNGPDKTHGDEITAPDAEEVSDGSDFF